MNKAYMKFLTNKNFDELIVGFIGETLRVKSLVCKTLINHWLFIKFVTVFHCQTFALYTI